MKCVKGRVVSSHPIYLSKAARVLSRFVTSESGSFSSQAVSAYLKRASASFNELVQFHKDLKSLRKSSKKDGSKSGKKRTIDETVHNGYISEEDAVKGPTGDSMIIESFDEGRKSERKKSEDDRQGRKIKKKKRKDVKEGEDFIDNDADGMKNERKRSEKVAVENVLLDSNETSAMKTEKKKKKKKAVD